MKTKLVKYRVCDQCYSLGISDADCICTYGKYKTIELEFEVCTCCGNLISHGTPADTKFNEEKLKNQ